jgi:hypothetical protein
MSTTTKAPKVIKNPAPKKKKGIVRKKPRWMRSPSERMKEDIAYLQGTVPIMRQLGVVRFQDIELAPALGRMAPLHKGGAHA